MPGRIDLPAPWYLRVRYDDEGANGALFVFFDGRHSAGKKVEHPERTTETDQAVGAGAEGFARFTSVQGHRRVNLVSLPNGGPSGLFTRAPDLCFVLSSEPRATPPALTLLAFSGPAPDGTVLTSDEAAAQGLEPATQVAAVRWFPSNGLVHQVYVAPSWRRRQVASKLLSVADLISATHDWPLLHGGAERTELGDLLVTNAHGYWRSRLAPRTKVMPPMTPGDDGGT
jgi:GNAT superfamily N-acetyltransferase